MSEPMKNENLERLSNIVEHAIGRLREAATCKPATTAAVEAVPLDAPQTATAVVQSPPPKAAREEKLAPITSQRVAKFEFVGECAFARTGALGRRFARLADNLRDLAAAERHKVFVFTGCNHGEGNTHTALNAARFVASDAAGKGRRVLLMDCDLRRPNVHKQIRYDFECGLEEALAGECEPEAAMVCSDADNLTVLPALLGRSGATELLQGERMDTLLKKVRAQFDLVFIDCPPVLSTTDPLVLGARADGVILTLKAGAARRDAVERACEALRRADAHVAGVVLTQTHP